MGCFIFVTPQPMSLEQFNLFVGSYFLVCREVAITSHEFITKGELLRKLPKWTVVKLSGEAQTDPETQNVRRACKVMALPFHDDESNNDNGIEGFVSLGDKTAGEANVRPYGIPGLSNPCTLTKEAVMTDCSDLSQKFNVVKRCIEGEKMQLLDVPVSVANYLLRAKVRAEKDGKEGFISLYDHKSRKGYINM